MASYPQYTQQYVVAPAPTPAQSYVPTAPTYDPNAYTAAPSQPYQAASTAHYSPSPQYGAPQYNRDELRTIFVTGFPPDMRERELSNLCRFLPGYEVRLGSARRIFADVRFDTGTFLRAEMARKNMYIRSDSERPTKTFRSDAGAAAPYTGPAVTGGFQDRNQTNPPCNTLFIGNLSPAIDDPAIESYFRNIKGDAFVTCKVNRSNPARVSAFVQFTDVAAASEVHDTQQGKEMPGSDRGPMRIQYSRNPLGEFGKRRREEAGYPGPDMPSPGGSYGQAGGAAAPQAMGAPTSAYMPPPDSGTVGQQPTVMPATTEYGQAPMPQQ